VEADLIDNLAEYRHTAVGVDAYQDGQMVPCSGCISEVIHT
jgi:hypothetical protein